MGVGPIPPNDAYSAAESNSRYAPGIFTPAAYGTIDKTGVSSSYQPIADAITAAAAAGGGCVLLPEGTLLIGDNTLTVPSKVHLIGTGRASTIIKSTSATGKDIISITGSRNRIHGFKAQGAAGGGYGIALASGSSRTNFNDVDAESCGGGGWKLTASNFLISWIQCEANSNTGQGWDLIASGTHNSLSWVECYANSNTGNGYQLYNAKGVNLVSSSGDNNGGYGFQMATARVNMVGCTAEANTTGGFHVVGSGFARFDGCSTNAQLLPFNINGSAATYLNECETASTPSGNSVQVTPSGTSTRNRMIGGSYDRNILISSGVLVRDGSGSGTPEGAVIGGIGSTWRRTDGGAATSFYVKESGTSNTGWVAK